MFNICGLSVFMLANARIYATRLLHKVITILYTLLLEHDIVIYV